jgi:uncharacterized protein (DUF2235 family)
VVILDGTMSTLNRGSETNAGLAYRLCREMRRSVSIYYEPGVQWQDWRSTRDVVAGRGINRQITRAYSYLASRYRPGDRIFLMGYSRGAYAVRSLAGVIDRVGLLRHEHATERNIRTAYRYYQKSAATPVARAFSARHCYDETPIEMIGVWDTVKSLGLNMPVLWRLTEARHDFHNHALSANVRHGYHALALDETREAYSPVLWQSTPDTRTVLEQVWFSGTHGDVGGQLGGFDAARPLSNIPLVWMLEKAAACGLPLPEGWQARFPRDATAPSQGLWRGYSRIFITRRRRVVGADPSESLHASVAERRAALPKKRARALPQFPGRTA